jgi:flagellar hook-length control protein FliK
MTSTYDGTTRICDAVNCIAEGGLGHVADGIFRIKDALAKWKAAKADSLKPGEERHKGLVALTEEVRKTTKRAREAVDPKENTESPKKARVDPHAGTLVKKNLPKPVKIKPTAILAILAEPRVTTPPKQQPVKAAPSPSPPRANNSDDNPPPPRADDTVEVLPPPPEEIVPSVNRYAPGPDEITSEGLQQIVPALREKIAWLRLLNTVEKAEKALAL